MQCSVSRAADLEHVLHVVVDLPEGGPPAVLPVPALPHQAVHAARAPGRTLHPVPALKQLKFKNIFNMYILQIFNTYLITFPPLLMTKRCLNETVIELLH